VTRIIRLRIPVSTDKEWVSVIPGADRKQVLVVRENGEELQVGIDADEPLEPQISKELRGRGSPG
jgi:hypothetical protein